MTEGAQRNLILWFFLSLFVVSIALLGWLLQPFISIIILGAVITGIFSPLYRRIGRKLRPSWASFLTCLLIFFVLFVPTVFFVSILSTEAYDLYEKAKGAVLSENMAALFQGSRINTLIRKSELLGRFKPLLTLLGFDPASGGIQRALSETAKTVGFLLYQQASAVATNILSFLFSFFLMLMVTYYLLIDGHRLLAFIISLSPLPPDQDQKLIQKFKDMAGAILIGNGLGGLIQGVLGGGLFAVFGLNSPFLWGVIIALTAFLPIVGSGVVFLPAAAMLLLKGRTAAGIFFILFFIVLFGSIEYVFKPQLVGSRVRMHTLLVFLSLLGGFNLFGALGIIYGPLVVTAFLTLTDIYFSSYQRLISPSQGREIQEQVVK
jgi:predicted PurR-regulated permease PerM